jgi:hypothetical protein
MNRIARLSRREREELFLATAHDIKLPEDCVPVLAEDYEHMKNMIFRKQPSFEEITGTLRRMEAEINALA